MLKTLRLSLSYLCIIICCLVTETQIPQAHAQIETITLAADSWYPYNGDPKSEHPGYMVEIAKHIFESNGYKVDYQIMPWARSIAEMEAGRINGIFGATKEEANDSILPLNALGKAVDSFFVLADSKWNFTNISSLKVIALAGITDYDYGSELQEYIEANKDNPKLMQLSNGETALEQNIRKLMAKRVGALIETPDVFWSKIKELGLSSDLFKEVGSAGAADPIYIAFSPKLQNSKKLAEMLDTGVNELRKNGQLAKILDYYGLKDWEK
jgi:polar amino acid transport system substrate-binding protein